jgi:hypothetical protein
MTGTCSSRATGFAACRVSDLLLVDGDPLADLSVLLDADRLAVIMKNGELYKNTNAVARRRAAA